MMRILKLGCAGTGKTTLARLLGERTGAPVIGLDDIWRPDWGEQEVPLFRPDPEGAGGGRADQRRRLCAGKLRYPPASRYSGDLA
jgi:predicted kinase